MNQALHIKLIILALLIFLNTKCFCQGYSLKDFTESQPPAKLSSEWYDLNNHGKDFTVSILSGKLKINNTKSYNPVISYSISDGTLLGINNGEWGGGLFFRPNDTSKRKYYVNGKLAGPQKDYFFGLMVHKGDSLYNLIQNLVLIKSGNIRFVFSFKDSIYFMDGLSHLTLRSGGIYSLKLKDNSFTGTKVLSLPQAPAAMYIHNDSIIIATGSGLYLINNWKAEKIFDDMFWEGLFPNSIAVKNRKRIYIGMRGGYAKINLPGKKLTFYKFSK
jgi:hypothetical protein